MAKVSLLFESLLLFKESQLLLLRLVLLFRLYPPELLLLRLLGLRYSGFSTDLAGWSLIKLFSCLLWFKESSLTFFFLPLFFPSPSSFSCFFDFFPDLLLFFFFFLNVASCYEYTSLYLSPCFFLISKTLSSLVNLVEVFSESLRLFP